jgi:hypothetical protein
VANWRAWWRNWKVKFGKKGEMIRWSSWEAFNNWRNGGAYRSDEEVEGVSTGMGGECNMLCEVKVRKYGHELDCLGVRGFVEVYIEVASDDEIWNAGGDGEEGSKFFKENGERLRIAG